MDAYLAPATIDGAAYLAPALPPSAADTVAPTFTGSITVSGQTSSGGTLAWPAASDDTAVAGYEYSTNDGGAYTSAGNVLTVTLSGLAASTSYPIRVRALDAAGNRSTHLAATLTTSAAANTTRTVTFELRLDAGTLAANLTGVMVSFHAASGPHVTGAALYQSSSETTDASGIISFTFTSSAIAAGANGLLAVMLPNGRHFLGLVAVA